MSLITLCVSTCVRAHSHVSPFFECSFNDLSSRSNHRHLLIFKTKIPIKNALFSLHWIVCLLQNYSNKPTKILCTQSSVEFLGIGYNSFIRRTGGHLLLSKQMTMAMSMFFVAKCQTLREWNLWSILKCYDSQCLFTRWPHSVCTRACELIHQSNDSDHFYNRFENPEQTETKIKLKEMSTKIYLKLHNWMFSFLYSIHNSEKNTHQTRKTKHTRNATMPCSERNSTGSKSNCLTLDSGLLLLFAQLVTLKPAKPLLPSPSLLHQYLLLLLLLTFEFLLYT